MHAILNKPVKVSGGIYMVEPGDATHYEFLMSRSLGRVYAGGKPNFNLYDYDEQEVIDFADFFPELINAKYEDYQRIAMTEINGHSPISHHFVGYITEHSGCRSYTALAFILCANTFLRHE